MSGSKKARVFVPLIKVDEDQRLVFGKITAQEVDQSGEMMDYETSKPNFESWSSQIEAGSGGLSKGNLRVMHGLSVAGKLTDIAYDDVDQSIEVCAKVVDDAEWNKVVEGCYTGFSVGGKYGKKWKETVDGETITKFTAVPNEVSLVDNPCVKSATFALVKADGAVEDHVFSDAVATIDPPEDTDTGGEGTDGPEVKVEKTETAPADHALPTGPEPTASAIAEKAGDLAKAANDGSTWQDHIATAREQLMKGDTALGVAVSAEQEGRTNDATGEVDPPEEDATVEGKTDDDATTDDDAEGDPVEKVTPAGVKQLWGASDGKTFEKKADCVAYEEELQKAATPKTEAEQLRERLAKATNPDETVEEVVVPVTEDFNRLAKVFDALSTPFADNGEPKLEKGMYTVNRFSNVLSDMASLSRSIKSEGLNEGGGDDQDVTIAADVIAAVKSLGTSFIAYATDQVQELLAGMDDDVVVGYYDYYYNAAQVDPENGLAKDVCSVVNELREPSRETRETLAKAFGLSNEGDEEPQDEMTPSLKKRFDALEKENEDLKKVANDAVAAVETLTKRVETVENTPLPRAPKNVVLKPGDNSFFGKTANTEEERMAVLNDMLKAEGPDALATKLIKLSHQNPIHIGLPNTNKGS
jgi:hypothetical protein